MEGTTDLFIHNSELSDMMKDCHGDIKGAFVYKFRHKLFAAGNICFTVFLWDGQGNPVNVWQSWMTRMEHTLGREGIMVLT
jgi:hypothetical protein